MSPLTRILLRTLGIVLTLVLFALAIAWGYRRAGEPEACRSITYILADGDERVYVFRNELEGMLHSLDIHPVGRRVDQLSLQRIENTVRQHPMVRTAECYITPWHDVRVVITQRVPLLRVQNADGTYLIDTDRRLMQARPAVKDSVLRVTGQVKMTMAAGQLADFAFWLRDNRYWRPRIDHVHIRSAEMAVVLLRDKRQPHVLIGRMDDYEKKLHKLQLFLDKGREATRDKQYTELDLRYAGQVVAR